MKEGKVAGDRLSLGGGRKQKSVRSAGEASVLTYWGMECAGPLFQYCHMGEGNWRLGEATIVSAVDNGWNRHTVPLVLVILGLGHNQNFLKDGFKCINLIMCHSFVMNHIPFDVHEIGFEKSNTKDTANEWK